MPDTEQANSAVKFTIQGHMFEAEPPFRAGHQLTEIEAGVINQTWIENLRNNFAANIKAEKVKVCETNGWFEEKDGKKVYDTDKVGDDDLDWDAIEEQFAKYAEDYEFGARRAGGPRAPVDPVEKEARRLALAKVKELLVSNGFKVSDTPKEQIDSLVDQALEEYPQIREIAQQLVDSQKSVSLSGLKI